MEHDKFCAADTPLGGGCECPVIAAIRADEREKAVGRLSAVPCDGDSECDYIECRIPTLDAIAAVRGSEQK